MPGKIGRKSPLVLPDHPDSRLTNRSADAQDYPDRPGGRVAYRGTDPATGATHTERRGNQSRQQMDEFAGAVNQGIENASRWWAGDANEPAVETTIPHDDEEFDEDESDGQVREQPLNHLQPHSSDMRQRVGDKSLDTQEPPEQTEEPYGATLMRQFHEDVACLMMEYDSALAPLDNELVKAFMTDVMKILDRQLLTGCEKAFKKAYKGLAPLDGSQEPAQQVAPEEDVVVETEESDVPPMEEDVESKDMDSMDDAGTEADSGPKTTPVGGDVVDGMQTKKKRLGTKAKKRTREDRPEGYGQSQEVGRSEIEHDIDWGDEDRAYEALERNMRGSDTPDLTDDDLDLMDNAETDQLLADVAASATEAGRENGKVRRASLGQKARQTRKKFLTMRFSRKALEPGYAPIIGDEVAYETPEGRGRGRVTNVDGTFVTIDTPEPEGWDAEGDEAPLWLDAPVETANPNEYLRRQQNGKSIRRRAKARRRPDEGYGRSYDDDDVRVENEEMEDEDWDDYNDQTLRNSPHHEPGISSPAEPEGRQNGKSIRRKAIRKDALDLYMTVDEANQRRFEEGDMRSESPGWGVQAYLQRQHPENRRFGDTLAQINADVRDTINEGSRLEDEKRTGTGAYSAESLAAHEAERERTRGTQGEPSTSPPGYKSLLVSVSPLRSGKGFRVTETRGAKSRHVDLTARGVNKYLSRFKGSGAKSLLGGLAKSLNSGRGVRFGLKSIEPGYTPAAGDNVHVRTPARGIRGRVSQVSDAVYVTPDEDAIATGRQYDIGIGNPSDAHVRPSRQRGYENGKAMKCPNCNADPCVCNKSMRRQKSNGTLRPGEQVDGEALHRGQKAITQTSTVPEFLSLFGDSDKNTIKFAEEFLHELRGCGDFGDEQRLKSFHFHKMLEPIALKGMDYGEKVVHRADRAWDRDMERARRNEDRQQTTSTTKPGQMSQSEQNKHGTDQGGVNVAPDSETGGTPEGHGKHFKNCASCSEFLKMLSREKAFGDPHRNEAGHHARSMRSILDLLDPDGRSQGEEPTTHEAAEATFGMVEPGEMGEKELKDLQNEAESQSKHLDGLAKLFARV